jgi:hypothetical protein
MKNTFILILIAAFTSATAQENGMFDIKKHIEKKRVEWKKQFEQKKSAFPPQTNCWGGGRFATPIPTISSLLNMDKVSINPKYKMPVTVTDMKRFQLMPNPSEDYFIKNLYFTPRLFFPSPTE